MSSYSAERKEAILRKLLPPHNKSVASVATEEGMAEQTLYNWRKQAREQGQPVPGKKSTPEQWSHETKFAVVVATATIIDFTSSTSFTLVRNSFKFRNSSLIHLPCVRQ